MNKYNKADKVLFIVFILLLCALLLKHIYSDSILAKAFFVGMEAALVGGIADWFAVTALFRKPLGFPWHTALIPNNQERLIEATAHMVQYEFFSKEKLKEQVQSVRLVDIIIGWVENQNGKQVLGSMVAQYIGKMLKKLDPKSVAAAIEKLLKNYSNQLKLVPAIQGIVNWVLDNRKDEQFLDYILTQLTEKAKTAATRQAIYDYLQQYKAKKTSSFFGSILGWIGEKTNSINIDDAADSFHSELQELLKELSNPSHPLRVLCRKMLEDAAQLSNNPEWSENIENWKKGVIERVSFQEPLIQIVTILIEEAQRPSERLEGLFKDFGFMHHQRNAQLLSSESQLMAWILSTMDKYWEIFRQDQEIQDWLEAYLQEAAHNIIDSEHDIIRVIVKDAMRVLSVEELNNLIASRTGEDLQYIRINGSIVGGIAGVTIFFIIQVAKNPVFAQIFR